MLQYYIFVFCLLPFTILAIHVKVNCVHLHLRKPNTAISFLQKIISTSMLMAIKTLFW